MRGTVAREVATPPWRAGLGGAAAAGGAGSTKNGNNTRGACPIGPVGARHARGALDKYKDAAGVRGGPIAHFSIEV